MGKNSIQEVLKRGVDKIYPSSESLEKLLKEKKIRLYLGIDPTGSRFHLGHTIPLRKLQEFADLGHEAILLFGTGTVLVGDPSQRGEARKRITEADIQENIKTWKKQAEKVLDLSKVKIRQNGDWLLKLTMKDFIEIASKISAVQLFKRDMFQERLKRGDTVWAHETFYPLLQGYDSVALDVDLEIGGTDQTFNMLIGRELLAKIRHKEKFVLTVPMILGTDGKPMSKSSGNCVWLDDPPSEMYGKLMSIPDEQINSYLELVTNLTQKELRESRALLPLERKKLLALSVTTMYHGKENAKQAQEGFQNVVQKKLPPPNTPEVTIDQKIFDRYHVPISGATISQVVATSANIGTAEAVRRVIGGAVSVDNLKITDPRAPFNNFNISEDHVLKVSRREYVRIKGKESNAKKVK